MESQYLLEQQVAERLALSVHTLRHWRLSGGGPRHFKFGRACRYLLSDVDTWAAGQARTSTSDTGAACQCGGTCQ
ncbi:MAG: helix-turn-helix domain-containing protein [Candidatus Sumerlaeota bacterium]|nr:helix-turn-helix domain-containing protein [Candidatus Sumerlaeota bacterium]